MLKTKRGVSLIEMMAVVSIIILLASMGFYTYTRAKMKSRDAKRIADLSQVQKALQLYKDDHGVYPPPQASNSWDYSTNPNFITLLQQQGYLDHVPVDPLNTTTYRYAYFVYSGGCQTAQDTRPFYILGIQNMETVPDSTDRVNNPTISPESPGFNCPNKISFYRYFEWVTGNF